MSSPVLRANGMTMAVGGRGCFDEVIWCPGCEIAQTRFVCRCFKPELSPQVLWRGSLALYFNGGSSVPARSGDQLIRESEGVAEHLPDFSYYTMLRQETRQAAAFALK